MQAQINNESAHQRPSERPNVHIDYQLKPKPYHVVVARLLKRFVGSGKVLDFGCGVGHTECEIGPDVGDFQFVLADMDPQCVSIATSRVPGSTGVVIGAEYLTELAKHGAFDAIVLSHVLEHVDNASQLLEDLRALIKPRGIMIIAVPNSVTPISIGKSLLRRRFVNLGHVNAWDRSTWYVFLENRLKLRPLMHTQDIFQIPFLWKRRWLWTIQIKLGQLFPWFCLSHISVVDVSGLERSH